jgi:mannosylfructose-phosphate synthase
MACGTPAVVTTEGGLWEHVTWGLDALYANPFDPETFGHAIYSALAYPRVAAQLAKYGSQTARARFTWTGIAQQLLRVMQSAELGIPHRRAASQSGGPPPSPGVDGADEVEEETWREEVFT